MIELKITDLFHVLADHPTGQGHARYYSGSIAELGPDAGRITWENSLRDGEKLLLPAFHPDDRRPTDQDLDALRDYAASFGAWDRAEIETWPPTHLLAFLLQDIAAAVREWDKVVGSDYGWCGDWQMYEAAAAAGRVSGRLYLDSRDEPEQKDDVWYTISD